MKNTGLLRNLAATITAAAVATMSVAQLSNPGNIPPDLQSLNIEIGLLVHAISCSDASVFPPSDLASCQGCCDGQSVLQGNWWGRYGCFLGCWSTFIPQEAEV